jgi:hypothetical protein
MGDKAACRKITINLFMLLEADINTIELQKMSLFKILVTLMLERMLS